MVGVFGSRDSQKVLPIAQCRLYLVTLFEVFLSVRCFTPFLTNFGPVLFGRPPASALKDALANLSQFSSLAQLRRVFGCYFPAALLAPTASGQNSRKRIFSLEVVFWSFLDQVQNPASSCREAVRKLMAYVRLDSPGAGNGTISADCAGYCQARARIPLGVIDQVHAHLVERMQKHIPHAAHWHGRHVKLVDGTGVSMPDTPENQERWPQTAGQKPGCGFPAMNLVGVFCLVTGALIHFATGSHHDHETLLFQSLWRHFGKGDLLVADRGYCSFGTFASLLARGADVLMRLPEKRLRKALSSKLPASGSFDVTADWTRPSHRPDSMRPEQFDLLPPSIPVRIIRYTHSRRGFRTLSVTLVTTVLDPGIAPAEFAELYFRRWGIELHFRELKTFLKMDVLRCLTPHMIEREMRMHFVAYNLIRCVMQTAALTHHTELRRVSFKGAMDTVRQFANAAQGAGNRPKTIAALVDEMLHAIALDLVPHRPGRSEPRAVKRRPKNHHRLTRPRRQMGNLPHRNTATSKRPKVNLS